MGPGAKNITNARVMAKDLAQVAAVFVCDYYQLRQLRPLVKSVSARAAKMLVQAFISCRLDYCT